MSLPVRRVPSGQLQAGFAALRAELDVPTDFPAEVLAAADAAARRGPAPDIGGQRTDVTDVPFVSIDPPGSKDLDQALHLSTDGSGYVVRYAIADVGAFIRPGDPLDVEAWRRGVSRYSPDVVTPLHPTRLSEDAASLLPGQTRPAVLWTFRLQPDGALADTHVERATVRSRAQLTYADAQTAIDDADDPMLGLLAKVGRLRTEREWVRGGVSLDLPDQEVHDDGDRYLLRYRAPLPVEGWNAQLSLLTGIAAGQMMVSGGVGILRTLPAPDPDAVQALRRRAWALALAWPPEVDYPTFVRTLDPHEPREAAMISLAAVGLRGAGYKAFVGAVPDGNRHEALATVYAHVTAPLRRLVDRYANAVVLALARDRQPPAWALERLSELPRTMAQARGRAGALDRAVLDLVEAYTLRHRVGQTFAATVVRSNDRGSDVALRTDAVSARIGQRMPPGTEVLLRLVDVDLDSRQLSFTVAEQP